jgi:tetratricopeptide (TPR) repeat protein
MARRFLVAFFPLLLLVLNAAAQNWTEVRTPHFVVVTDAGEKKGREVALRFEQVRSGFGTLLQRSTINIPVATEIVAFRNRAELERFSGPANSTLASGFFLRGQDRQFVALDLSSTDPYGPVLHDIALMLLEANYPRTELWFDEGFAQYLATAQISNKEISVGAAGERHGQVLNTSPWMPFTDVAKVTSEPKSDGKDGSRALFDAESWMLVHYIFDQHKLPEAANYFDLVENHGISPAEAVRRAFGVDAATFLKDVQNHYRSGRAVPYRIPTPESLQLDLFSVRTMTSIEAKAALADLHAYSPAHREEAVSEYEAILKIAPNYMPAHRGLGYIAMEKGDLINAAKYLKDGLAINAKDPGLLYYSALLLTKRPDPNNMHRSDPAMMESYLVGATNLNADFAEAWNLLAYARRRQDKIEPAIDAAANAVKLSPRNEEYQQALAQLYVDAHQWDNAQYVYTALSSSKNGDTARSAKTMLAAIDRAKQTGEKIVADKGVTNPVPETNEEDKVIDHGMDKSANAPPEKRDLRPVKFMRATLAGVSCDGKSAVLSLALSGAPKKGAKTSRIRLMKMLVPDIQQVILVGVDTFSCDWRNQKVGLNYKEGASPNAVAKNSGYEGDVVSIEMQ